MTLTESIVLAAVTGAIAIAGTIVGNWFSERSARAREATNRDHADRRAAADRVRGRYLRDIAETRAGLDAHLLYLERTVLLHQKDLDPVDLAQFPHLNITLIGDAELVRDWTDLVTELSREVPLTNAEVRRHGPLRAGSLDVDQLSRVVRVRAEVGRALDIQEDRALRDLPLRELSPAELDALPGNTALVELFRERAGKPPPP